MAIDFKKYVDITSAVGGAGNVRQRDLILRLFTSNVLLGPGVVMEFTALASVGAFFGTDSEEYSRAEFYFGFISKAVTSPQKISYARWVPTAVAPEIYGGANPASLSALNAVTAGGFSLVIAGTPTAFTAMDLSAAGSLTAVAADLQTKIRTASGTMFTAATVTYDAQRGAFDIVMGVTGNATISVTDGAQTPLALLKLTASLALTTNNGSAIESITSVLDGTTQATNNFGSFAFMDTLSLDQVTEGTTWNASQGINFMFLVPVILANDTAWSAALISLPGTGLTLTDAVDDQYPEMVPGMILAATVYNTRRSVSQNYEFQVVEGLDVTVSDTTLSDTLDALRINYYGNTQTNGQEINFYQQGKLTGDPAAGAAVDMNVYGNEAWLKDKIGTTLMSLLLSLGEVPANRQGQGQVAAAIVQGAIGSTKAVGTALFNGVISVGKTFTIVQQQYVTNITGDPNAWQTVQNVGWWLEVNIVPVTQQDGSTDYQAVYTLVYSKDDAIRKIVGSDILI